MYSFQVSIIKISHFTHITNRPIQELHEKCPNMEFFLVCIFWSASFASFSYKISLAKYLIDRSFKIYNNCNSFHNDIENINFSLNKNAYPLFLINKVINKYLDYKFCSNQSQLRDISCCHFKTRIEEYIEKDNKSHIFKHLHSTATCFDSYNYLYFKMIDNASSKFDLKLKKLYILIGENPT